MSNKDSLGDRMKEYENAFHHYLPRRLPLIIRIDGCSFSNYTNGFEKPFDSDLANAFWETCKYLTSIQGFKVAYHQSDEISLLLTNYDKLTTDSWFKNRLDKIASVSASMATAKFNEIMQSKHPKNKLAHFDARAFVLPHDEVNNYFLWRQQDATKNSISMLGQKHFSQKQLDGLNGSQVQDLLMLEKGVNWNDIPVWQKRGTCILKESVVKENDVIRNEAVTDLNIPIFSQSTEYINRFVYLDK